MIQLEQFRKLVDKDILKKMKMSPEQFKRFLRDYAALARRQEVEKDQPEKLAPPSKKGTLNATGGTIKRDGGKTGDLNNEGRPKPPPGYRDSYNDLLKMLNVRK
jgi:hypothetical protein